MKTTILLILIALGLGAFWYYDQQQRTEDHLEVNAVSLVDSILEDHWLNILAEAVDVDVEVAKCEQIKIVERIGKSTYTAVALLDNGSTLDITIQDLDDFIRVQLAD